MESRAGKDRKEWEIERNRRGIGKNRRLERDKREWKEERGKRKRGKDNHVR